MTHVRQILVATDFGDAMEPSIEMAVSLATSLNATLTLMHAYTVPPIAYATPLPMTEDLGAIRTDSEAAMTEAVDQLRARWPKSAGVTREGPAATTILDAAKEYRSDLIVMGTHGRHGLVRMLLGSVAEEVSRRSSVPVLTVHPRAPVAPALKAAPSRLPVTAHE